MRSSRVISVFCHLEAINDGGRVLGPKVPWCPVFEPRYVIMHECLAIANPGFTFLQSSFDFRYFDLNLGDCKVCM